MSYASVAASNTPISEQPQPDQALLNTAPPTANNVVDDSAKLNLVSPNFKSHPATRTSQAEVFDDDEPFPPGVPDKKKKKSKHLQEAEAETLYLWNITKQYLFRPGVAGGLIGLINVGLLAGAGRAFYLQPRLRRDTTAISSAVAATLALLTVEGYAAEKYRQTPSGQAEERRAKQEGSLIYRQLQEQLLRPKVAGGLLGIVNAAILGTVGYFSYINWDRPTWDRRTVSAVSVGLLALWGGEGFIAERFRTQRH